MKSLPSIKDAEALVGEMSENARRGDKIAAIVTTALLATYILWFVSGEANTRNLDCYDENIIIATACLACGLAFYLVFRSRWCTKYILIGLMMVSVFILVAGVDYSLMNLMCLPLVTCSLYFRPKMTTAITVIGLILMFAGLLINNDIRPIFIGMYYGQTYIDTVIKLTWAYYLVEATIFVLISLVSSFATIGGLNELKRQVDLKREKTAFERDAQNAKGIQEGLLITDFPCREYCDIASSFSAAKYVGGDFYDCFKVDDERLAVVIADVSGKGLPAAMFMATAVTLIRSNVHKGTSLAKAMEKANRELASNNSMKYFVTVWIGILDLRTGDLEYIDAGHNPPFARLGGEYTFVECKPDFVFGRKKKIRYNEQYMKLDVGDRLFLYTDGVTEAVSDDGSMYGEDRLKVALDSGTGLDVEGAVNLIKDDLAQFVGNHEQSDDITMLALEYTHRYDRSYDEGITVPADNEGYARMMARLQQVLSENGCSARIVSEMQTACSEIFANIDMYAYGDNKGDVRITMDVIDGTVRIQFTDTGEPFNPLEHVDPDPVDNFKNRRKGGLGIMIVKKICDDVAYKRDKDRNILTIEKEI